MVKGFGAASTTALLGMGQLGIFSHVVDLFQFAAIFITAALAVVTAWDGLFRHKGLWLLNAETRNNFVGLKQDVMHADQTGTLNDELLISFYQKYKQIWTARNQGWYDLRKYDS